MENKGEKKKKGPTPRGNDYHLTVYLNEKEETALRAYCRGRKITRAAAVREWLREKTGGG